MGAVSFDYPEKKKTAPAATERRPLPPLCRYKGGAPRIAEKFNAFSIFHRKVKEFLAQRFAKAAFSMFMKQISSI
jgi:hypothetical protein